MNYQEEKERLEGLSLNELNNEVAELLGWTEIAFGRHGWRGISPSTHKEAVVPGFAWTPALALDVASYMRDTCGLFVGLVTSPEPPQNSPLTRLWNVEMAFDELWLVSSISGSMPTAVCMTALLAKFQLEAVKVES